MDSSAMLLSNNEDHFLGKRSSYSSLQRWIRGRSRCGTDGCR